MLVAGVCDHVGDSKGCWPVWPLNWSVVIEMVVDEKGDRIREEWKNFVFVLGKVAQKISCEKSGLFHIG